MGTKENMVWHVSAGPKGGGQAYRCFDPVGDSLHIFRAKRVLDHAIAHIEKISAFPAKSSDFPDYESGRARMGGGSCADVGYLYPLGRSPLPMVTIGIHGGRHITRKKSLAVFDWPTGRISCILKLHQDNGPLVVANALSCAQHPTLAFLTPPLNSKKK